MDLKEDKVVTLGRYSNASALVLESMLEAEGIDSFLMHENMLQGGVSLGVEVKVRETDLPAALKVAATLNPEPEEVDRATLKSFSELQKIMVPVDFSEESLRALQVAFEIACRNSSELRLIHVYYNPIVNWAPFDNDPDFQVNLVNFLNEAEQSARMQLAALKESLIRRAEEKGCNIKLLSNLANGVAADEILAESAKHEADIVVIGTKGIGHQTEGFLGRVAQKIVERSTVPILAIPMESDFDVKTELKNVLYATDFDKNDAASLSKLISLLDDYQVNFHCVHVSIGRRKAWDETKMEELRSFVQNNFPNTNIRYEIVVGDDVVSRLETYMRVNSIDLIALNNRDVSFLQSLFTPNITKKIMERVNKPLFVFKT